MPPPKTTQNPTLAVASGTRQDRPRIMSRPPPLPPEVWIHIIDFLPFEILWALRRTSKLWNSLALVRVWHLVRDSEVAIWTYFDSEHKPLSYLTPIPQLLRPLIPEELQSNHALRIAPGLSLPDRVTWRVCEDLTTDCDSGLRFSYHPRNLEICFPDAVSAAYNIQTATRTNGRYSNLARTEQWEGTKFPKTSKFSKFFWRKRSESSASIRKGPQPEWVVQYRAQYTIDADDEGKLAVQLCELTLQEVSLPVLQIVRVWTDGLWLRLKGLSVDSN
jgi:F-box domain